MAIPISNYIDIKSVIVQGSVGTHDFSGLVFTGDSMLDTADSTIKEKYDNGDVVALTRDAITMCFAENTHVSKYAPLYFGYGGGNKTPSIINVKKVSSGTALAAYESAIAQTTNFGAFTFLDSDLQTIGTSGSGGILDVGVACKNSENVLVVSCTPQNEASTKSAFTGNDMVHVVVNSHMTEIVPASAANENQAVTSNFGSWCFMSWYAAVDYTMTDASSTIDYKQFPEAIAEVTTEMAKNSYDNDHVNYVGLVQVNGTNLSFYQRGVQMSGVDSGVIRDKVWISGEIAAGWLSIASTANKIPANYLGAAMVRAMVADVANKGVNNGAILLDKPLTGAQIAAIRAYTNREDAADQVQNNGYYIDTNITQETDGRYVCQYILIYAKGDHIGKVSGTNYLV